MELPPDVQLLVHRRPAHSLSEQREPMRALANRELSAGRLAVGPNGILPDAGNVLNINGVIIQLSGGRVMNGVVRIGSFSGIVRLR